MSATLSTNARAGLRANGMLTGLLSATTKETEPRQAAEVTSYRCPDCGDLHEDKAGALECCAPAASTAVHDQDVDEPCPVCATNHHDHRNAADCCLWRDLDAPTRWRIADAVEAGSTWVDAMAAQGVDT